MSFDKTTRNLLARMVGQARDQLTADVMDQLLRLGFQPDGSALDLNQIAGLTESEREAAQELREQLDHFIALESGSDAARRKSAYGRLAREIGFTTFNRLVALRMAEERGLIVQAVGGGLESDGFQLYERVAHDALGNRIQTYRAYLELLYDELALDLPLLFDRMVPESRIFPSERCLEATLDLLNSSAVTHLWKEDEAIGWVYQYYNDPAERKKMRETTPLNSRALAVRNQFFTPRYVVEFLTDNTLGRIWYEMRRGETRLADSCQYLVRRKHPIWLPPGQLDLPPFDPSKPHGVMEDASEQDMWTRPNPEIHEWMPGMVEYALTVEGYAYAQEHLAAEGDDKPAGFSLVAELANSRLQEYRETGTWRGTFEELRLCLFFEQRRWRHSDESMPEGDYWAGLQALYKAICEAWDREADVIAYRSKKDPRDLRTLDPACGSGHFLLYSFDLLETIYEEAWADALTPHSEVTGTRLRDDYPDLDTLRRAVPGLVLRHNLYGVDIDPRACQITGLALWLRAQRSYQQLGLKPAERPPITRSNIVCAEPMPGEREMLDEYLRQHVDPRLHDLVRTIWDKMQLAGDAGTLLKIEQEIEIALKDARDKALVDVPPVQVSLFQKRQPVVQERMTFSTAEERAFWTEAEAKLLTALRNYASQATDSHATQRRLFKEDAEQGFAFIDLSRQEFEVVVMNPPFGEASVPSRSYVYSAIPSSTQDLFAAFVARWCQRLLPRGYVGALTNRLALFKDLLEPWRIETLLGDENQLEVLADLGYGVLDDAVVEAAAYVVGNHQSTISQQVSVFISLLNAENKLAALLNSLSRLRCDIASPRLYVRSLSNFRRLPNKIVAYWGDPGWLSRFNLNPIARKFGLIGKKGLETGDDPVHLRLLWEIPNEAFIPFKRWTPYSKGGPYRPYHADIHLAFDWAKRSIARRVSNSDLYGRGGLTYTERTTSNFAARILPAQTIFSPKGPGLFDTEHNEVWGLLGFLNSSIVIYYVELFVGGGDASSPGTAARDFAPILFESLPVPPHFRDLLTSLRAPARSIYELLQRFRIDETSSQFVSYSVGESPLICQSREHFAGYEQAVLESLDIFSEIDRRVEDAYNISEAERHDLTSYLGRPLSTQKNLQKEQLEQVVQIFSSPASSTTRRPFTSTSMSRANTKLSYIADPRYEFASAVLGISPRAVASARARADVIPSEEVQQTGEKTLSYSVGCVFGRWDVRIGADPSFAPKLADPFAPLPVCAPGALVGPDGMPARPGNIVSEEWLCARPDAITLPPPGSVQRPKIADDEYPIRIAWDGILVDDPEHPADIVQRVREVLAILWPGENGAQAESIEREACDILGVHELRDYFRRPSGFFEDHLKRYSKSRRQAPIYWPLSTASGSYTLWIYYHRLTSDTLYTALNRYVEPKIEEVGRRLADDERELESTSGREASRLRASVEQKQSFLRELRDFRDELRRVAALPYRPDLNDGVIITAAPLHRLFHLPRWARDTKATWEKLERGDYDWALLAYTLWPERAREKCRTDKSLAIAHGLEELYVEPPATAKKARGRKVAAEEVELLGEEEE